jgi:signal transduction histidine kinase
MRYSARKKKPRDVPGEQIGRLQKLLEATKTLSSTLDLAHLTDIILQIIRQEVPVERVTAFMVDEESKILRSLVAQGVGDFVIRIPIGVGIAGTVARTGEILDVPHAYEDTRFYPAVDRLLGYHTRDIFCLPILSREREIMGVLELLNREGPITPSNIVFLKEVSTHIGLALERAWSHRELLEKQKVEETLKDRRDRLAALDRVEIMGELLNTVMHELNNPLAILVGNVDLLKRQLGPDVQPRANHYVEKIEMAADRSAATLRKFFRFVEAPQRQRRPLDLAEVLQQTIALRADDWERDRIQVDNDVHSVPLMMASEEEMQYVFTILLKNAEEAVAHSATEARIIIRCSYNAAAASVRIDIADNGPGIPSELQARIFEPLFTMKPKGTGTGLGLIVARRIIEEHGGKIWLTTKEDVGTTVRIELPRRSAL